MTEEWKEHLWRISLVTVVIIGVLLPLQMLEAGPVSDLINYVVLGVAWLIGKLINFLGTLAIMLVDVIIGVAQYNTFVNANPVKTGWPLVRDITNMFFIVVLLVTAFATIVQWRKFDYKKILPKLLLMAVLVNFSLTLVGLLIDFSQVIMLTFVNGFKAAAGGNFVQALKLTEMMKLHKSDALTKQQQAASGDEIREDSLTTHLLVMLLALVFLGVTITMLFIMLIYLIFRIVGLWVALIMSPLAFFATSLQSTPLSNYVGFITEGFWKKLGALLAGGPVMAFFLWLTLATVQGDGFGQFKSAETTEVGAVENFFGSAISNVEDVASFFVAIVLLLMGVQMALATSNAVSPVIGRVTKGLPRLGARAGRATAGIGLAAGAGSARLAGRGGRAAFRAAGGERLVGRGLQRVGARIPLVGAGVSAIGARMAGAPRKRALEQRKQIQERYTGLETGDRLAAMRNERRFATGARREALNELIADTELSGLGGKELMKEEKAKLEKNGIRGPEAEALADKRVKARQSESLEALRNQAERTGDKELFDKVEETEEKMPHLVTDMGKRQTLINKMLAKYSPSQFARTIAAPSWADTEFADMALRSAGVLNDDGSVNKDSEHYKPLVKGGGLRGNVINRRLAGPEAGQTGHYALINNKLEFVPKAELDAAEARESTTTSTERKALRNEPAIAEGKSRIARLREEGTLYSDEGRVAQGATFASGAEIHEVYNIDADGKFKDQTDRLNFEQNIQSIHQAGDSDVYMYSRLNLSDLRANASGENQARKEFVRNTSVDQLRNAYKNSSENLDARRAVSEMVGVVDTEGRRVEKMIDDYNTEATKLYQQARKQGGEYGTEAQIAVYDQVDKEKLMAAVRSGNETEVKKELSGLADRISVEDAQALEKRDAIGNDAELKGYVQYASSRTARAVAGRGRGGGGAT